MAQAELGAEAVEVVTEGEIGLGEGARLAARAEDVEAAREHAPDIVALVAGEAGPGCPGMTKGAGAPAQAGSLLEREQAVRGQPRSPALNKSPLTRPGYSGMLSCFFQGFSMRLLRSICSALATRLRVACGRITSSI